MLIGLSGAKRLKDVGQLIVAECCVITDVRHSLTPFLGSGVEFLGSYDVDALLAAMNLLAPRLPHPLGPKDLDATEGAVGVGLYRVPWTPVTKLHGFQVHCARRS